MPKLDTQWTEGGGGEGMTEIVGGGGGGKYLATVIE